MVVGKAYQLEIKMDFGKKINNYNNCDGLKDYIIAVIIPCYNEAISIGKVVKDFRSELPGATIYVYDNNSTDGTAYIAQTEGAIVRKEKRQGKGYVIASMFEEIEADIYIMVDGDNTYPAEKVHQLIKPISQDDADMVVGNRLAQYGENSFRNLHIFGNQLVRWMVNIIFNVNLIDIMSGYRAFNKKFVNKIPLISKGFEVETQITLQALHYGLTIKEVPVHYRQRPKGSLSKLNTLSDGTRVLIKIIDIFKAYRPLLFFSIIGMIVGAMGLTIGSIPIFEFLRTGQILHYPAAILATGIMIISFLIFGIGIVLDSINHRFKEAFSLINSKTGIVRSRQRGQVSEQIKSGSKKKQARERATANTVDLR